METIQEKILAVLLKNGPMTSDGLCKELELEWVDFSGDLEEMIKSVLNPEGKIIREKEGFSGPTTYRLA